MLPVSQLIIRNFVITHISAESAGYWQGVLKISDIYMAVIISSLSLYYLPGSRIKIRGIGESILRLSNINTLMSCWVRLFF